MTIAKGKFEEWLKPDGLTRLESWARDGLTNEQISAKIGVSTVTLYDWFNRFPDILNAVKKGKAPIDFEVENALLKRAKGYDVTETFTETKTDGSGNIIEERTRRITRHIPADTTAQIFWLKNRKPEQWRDKRVFADDIGPDDPVLKLLERLDKESAIS